jgi:hypothetical protein
VPPAITDSNEETCDAIGVEIERIEEHRVDHAEDGRSRITLDQTFDHIRPPGDAGRFVS